MLPVPPSVDFAQAVINYAALSRVEFSPVEFILMKRLYEMVLEIAANPPAKTIPATPDNIFAVMSQLAGKDFNASRK